jgi:hypothetical protein
MDEGGGGGNSSDDSLPNKLAVPLVLDDTPMEEENEILEDVEEDIERHRNRVASRTIFHQPRGDNDTM